MSTIVTVPPRGRPPAATRVRGSGSLVWLAVPALLVFVAFGVIPLLGVLALSFTTWDGLSQDISFSGLTSWSAVLSDPGLPHALWVTFLIMALSWLVQTLSQHPHRGVPGGPSALPRADRRAVLHPAAAQLGRHRDHVQGAARPEFRARRRAWAWTSWRRTGSARAPSPSAW
ncbi:hypothetical protein ACFSTC_25455 [Nonomuraea ferruginea]